MFCRKCGKEIPDGSAFCSFCGASADGTAEQQKQQPVIVNVVNTNTNTNQNINGGPAYAYKSKWAAFFLCFFLGELGVHRFYVGKVGTGILWLFTFGLLGIGWLFDLLRILFGAFHDKLGYPLR